MAIKNLFSRGIGHTGGEIKWVVTRGFGIGAPLPPGGPLVTQYVTLAGIVETYVGASTPNDTIIDNDGRSVLRVRNGSGSTVTVTVSSLKPCTYGFIHNVAVDVAAGTEELIGTFSVVRFGRIITVSCSFQTGITLAVEGVGAQ